MAEDAIFCDCQSYRIIRIVRVKKLKLTGLV